MSHTLVAQNAAHTGVTTDYVLQRFAGTLPMAPFPVPSPAKQGKGA
jgi:hypothetical protein